MLSSRAEATPQTARRLIAGAAALSAALGCLPDQRNCERTLAVGDRLAIRIGAARETASPCDPTLGVAADRTLEAEVTAFGGAGSCAAALVMVDELDDWEIAWREQEAGGSHLLEAHYRVTRGSCKGSLHFDVNASQLPTPPLDSSDAAALRVSYLADQDLPECPLSCSAQHAVRVERR